MSTGLVHYEAMRAAIDKAVRIDEVKNIRDKAEALRQYARQVGESLENQNKIAEIKIRAERRAGELLEEMDNAKPGPKTELSDIVSPNSETPTLSDLGISNKQSSRWQSIAAIPEERFEQAIAEVRAATEELTSSVMLRVAQECKRESQRHEDPPAITGKYRVWYADPPWHYGNSGVITEGDNYGRAARHYPSMTIAELCAMGADIKAACEDDAVLFMWVTSPLLEECFPVIKAWGFQYKTSFVWDKQDHNFGHYNSVRHEFLLVCTRGSCLPDDKKLYDSVMSVKKSDRHSEKPEEFRRLIDGLYTRGNKIELFARTVASGWHSWGNEVG